MDLLKYIFQKPMRTGKLAKWQILLAKAVKAHALADHMTENPVDDDYRPLKTYFPDEQVAFVGEDISEEYDGWRMFFDGAKNLSGSGIRTILISPTGKRYPVSAKLRFLCTNNMAEYEACILGLRRAIDLDVQELLIIGDSDLLIHQVRGDWATKNQKLLPYLECLHRLCKRFVKTEFRHVPRVQNEFADALDTLSSMIRHPDHNYIDPIHIYIHEQPGYCFHVEEEPDGKTWYDAIRGYLKSGEYTEDATNVQKRTIRRLATQFFLSGETLYRRTPDLGLLRCVEAGEACRLVEEIHAGTCGSHMNGFTLAKKILRSGYYCLTMEIDCIRYVQKCRQCQNHADMIRVPPNELHVTSSPWPFAAWGMDVIGPIEPTTSNGHRFILVAIEYFTKWVEVTSHNSVKKKVVDDLVKNIIICRFGIPESIITDNVTNLNSDLMRSMCEKFKISHQNSTAYRPQMNGEKLPFALLGYRTTIRTSTKATPYFLLYGTEAVILAEVELPSLRIIQEANLSDADWIQGRAENLALIDGRLINAICHGQLYQNRMARAFNKKVKPRHLSPRQRVLKRIFPNQDKAKGKSHQTRKRVQAPTQKKLQYRSEYKKLQLEGTFPTRGMPKLPFALKQLLIPLEPASYKLQTSSNSDNNSDSCRTKPVKSINGSHKSTIQPGTSSPFGWA
ncbi:uncharacterized protein LOC107019279 [Solanum pennellii]|uniref:Uncharacterized protein LOC107019279 n=1 Tax=Solanum pennellii TaxID=28526 RepID=A0ABM1GSM2_SOLPN|nr:uncharacterized protein LOC107019279 [Solanum pennellii]